MKITALCIYSEIGNEDIIETIIENENLDILGFSSVFDNDKKTVCVEIYSEKKDTVLKNKKIIEEKAKEIELEIKTEIRELSDDEYLYAYKQYLKPLKAGDITIVPGDRDSHKEEGLTIYIPKQYAFGTGSHETTLIALEFLHDYAKKNKMDGVHLVDVGCGSGILSLAASLYGAFDITAIDNDIQAVSCTKDNMRYNEISLARVLEAEPDDLSDEGQKYNLTIANIETEILIKILPSLCEITNENGKIILSGILKERMDDMKYRVNDLKLKIEDIKEKTEWAGMLLSF